MCDILQNFARAFFKFESEGGKFFFMYKNSLSCADPENFLRGDHLQPRVQQILSLQKPIFWKF